MPHSTGKKKQVRENKEAKSNISILILVCNVTRKDDAILTFYRKNNIKVIKKCFEKTLLNRRISVKKKDC